MARISTFRVDAERIQGNAGAWVEFKAIKVGEFKRWAGDPDTADTDLLRDHLVAWGGFEDDDGHALPNPKDEPGIVEELYFHEQRALIELLVQGPVELKN